jgi:hypothetical protein
LRPSGWNVEVGFNNDSIPPFGTSLVLPQDLLMPDSQTTDDDGATFGARVNATYTDNVKGQQFGVVANYAMLTQDGANAADPTKNKRIDLLDVVTQFTKTQKIAPGTSLDLSAGFGVQISGKLGGLDAQTAFHEITAGRLPTTVGNPLQTNYTTDGVAVGPQFTVGIGLRKTESIAPGHTMDFGVRAQANFSANPQGVSAVGAEGFVRYENEGVVRVEGSFGVARGITNSAATQIVPFDETHLSAELKVQLDAANAYLSNLGVKASPYLVFKAGGPTGDFTAGLGITFGLTEAPWLDPGKLMP